MTTTGSISLTRVFDDTRAEIVDAVVAVESMISALQAHRATLISEAAVMSAVGANVTSDPTAWDARVVARKELESELACALRIPERSAQRLIGESEMLVAHLPGTLAALQAGVISYRHAQKMIDHASDLPDGSHARFEAELLPFAARLSVAKFDAKARKHREAFHPETISVRRVKAVEDRSVTFEPGRDGMGWLTAYLPAEQGVAIYTAITDAAMRRQGPAETRTLPQLRADVFADQMLGGNGLEGIVPTVFVTVPVATVLGASEPGTLDGYGPIAPETARRLAGRAPSVTRLLTDAGQVVSMGADRYSLSNLDRLLTNPETSVPLTLERESYKLPRRVQRWIKYRDGTCRFPGCGRAARKTDIDHLVDWASGGPSNYDNLFCLCAFHHKMKHNTRWRVRHLGEGVLRWTSPDGKEYDTYPDNPIRAG